MKYLNVKNILFVLVLFFIGFLLVENHNLKNKAQSNYVILSDSLTNYKNKVGELYKEKESYIIDNENLKNINNDLYKEIKNLKDNPIVITKTEIKYEIKEVFIKDDSVKVDSVNNIIKNFYNYNDDYFSAKLTHSLDISNNNRSIFFDNINAKTNLFVNIIEKNKKPFLVAKSDNPYLTISNLDGGFIDLDNSDVLNKYYKRENRWNLSFNLGVFTIYNINTGRFEAGPGFGFSIGRSFAQW